MLTQKGSLDVWNLKLQGAETTFVANIWPEICLISPAAQWSPCLGLIMLLTSNLSPLEFPHIPRFLFWSSSVASCKQQTEIEDVILWKSALLLKFSCTPQSIWILVTTIQNHWNHTEWEPCKNRTSLHKKHHKLQKISENSKYCGYDCGYHIRYICRRVTQILMTGHKHFNFVTNQIKWHLGWLTMKINCIDYWVSNLIICLEISSKRFLGKNYIYIYIYKMHFNFGYNYLWKNIMCYYVHSILHCT